MDWKKAKNYTIIFLLILNVMLFGLNLIKYNKYNLSQEQKNDINAILNKNNITVATEMPDNYKPMPQITLKSSSYDAIELQKIFFNSITKIRRTEEFDKTIFSVGNESLKLYGNHAFYENNNIVDNYELSRKTAVKSVEKYIDEIEKNFSKLKLIRTTQSDEYIILEYDQSYLDNLIFNNSVIFTVYADGRFNCKLSYFEPMQMTGEKTDICSSDEALFVFYKGIKNVINTENLIKITEMNLGYYTEDYMQTDLDVIAVPHYRIFVEGIDEPYYINAYNSSMVYE